MRYLARLLAGLSMAAVLAACRGTSSGPLPAVGSASLVEHSHVLRPIASVSFVPIGPTHMSDGLPASGKVNAYAVDPTNAKLIYVAGGRGTGLESYSSMGVYRSTNGGASWTAIDDGLTDPSGVISSAINALWIDPVHPRVLLAASEYDGIFRTSNGGTSWSNVYRTQHATQFAAFTGGVYAATAAGILVSTDGGSTWNVSMAGTSKRAPTAFGSAAGTSAAALYAGMTDGSMYAFNGHAWSKRGTLPFNPSTGTDGSSPAIHQIAVDPQSSTTLYASTNDGSWDQNLFASTDSGVDWTAVLQPKYYDLGLGTQAIAFSAVHPHLLYLGTDGDFYDFIADGSASPKVHQAANLSVIDVRNVWPVANGSDDACWVASDQGLDYEPACSTHERAYQGRIVTSTTATGLARRFTVSPDGKTLMVSLQDFDSHYTIDGGNTWKPYYDLYEDGFNELRPGSPNYCYAYDEASGLSYSSDGCRHYNFIAYKKGIYPSRLMTTPLAFDPKTPQKMYLMAGPIVGFSGTKFGAYTTSNNGQTITKLGWPFSAPGMIVVDATNGKHILVGNLASGHSTISVSFDGGTTWKTSRGVPATAFWYSATISPVNPKLVLASSVDARSNVFVLRSADGGLSFRRVANVVNAPLLRGRIDLDVHGRRTGEPSTGETDETPQRPPAFVYSPAREIRFNQGVTSGTPDVALTTLRGAFVSTDLGSTWQRVDDALVAHSFWGIRWNDGYLYLASDGQGVVRSTTAVQP